MELQTKILDEIMNSKREIELILLNGFRMKGTIEGHDKFSIVFKSNGQQQMILKHAISTSVR
ncbi:RNA chaperone Hfq [Metabacillus sp. Hm71]|uniref:RNA chaperone Hfq n=1 Tax=Metabacillus sp. Hm71 TaxID=3450743 RepID=UPI003F43B521